MRGKIGPKYHSGTNIRKHKKNVNEDVVVNTSKCESERGWAASAKQVALALLSGDLAAPRR